MIDLRRLRMLQAVAHHGTVAAAAEALNVTPSAASHQVRLLGRELGVTLLEPYGRGVRLTAAARDLLDHAAAIEERWQQAYAALHSHAEPAGPLRLCGIPTAITGLLAPAARALATSHPGIAPEITEAEPGEAVDRLLADTVDLAVYEPTPGTPPVDDPRIDQQPLLDDPFDLLVPAGHPLAAADRVTLDQAARQDWVIEMAPSSSRHSTLAACAAAGFSPRIAHQARQWTVVATLVGYGLGVALVPRLAQLPALPVVRVPLRGRPIPGRRLLIASRRGSAGHPVLAAAIAALHTAADQPSPTPP